MNKRIFIFTFLLAVFATGTSLADKIDIVHETSGIILKSGASSAAISTYYAGLDLYYHQYAGDFDLIAPEKDGCTVKWLTLPQDDSDTRGSNSHLENFTDSIASGATLTKAQMANARHSAANFFASNRVARLYYDPIPLTVTFNANGGGGAMSPVTGKDYESEFDLPTNTFTRTGHTMTQWTNAVGNVFSDGQTVKGSDFWNPSITNFSSVLYANWTANEYTVTFDGNGGGAPSPVSKIVTYDQSYGELAACSRDGWEFDGWYTEKSGGQKVESTTKVAITESQTLYAHWTQKFTVTFLESTLFETHQVLKEEYVLAGGSATPPAHPEHEGYTFDQWKGTYTNVRANEDVRAKYLPNPYTVMYHANDGSGRTQSQKFEYDTGENLDGFFTRTGYVLQGWTTDEVSSEVVYEKNAKVLNLATGGTVHLYALWTPIAYAVKFGANGGEGTMSQVDLRYDDTFMVPECAFTKAGCEFKWWSTTVGGVATNFTAGAVVSNLTSKADDTVTFTAEWLGRYTVAFDANGGSGTMTNLTLESDVEYQLPSNAFSKVGYRFFGWATNEADAVALRNPVYTNEATVVNLAKAGETCTLFAEWQTNTYTVVFLPGGAKGTMEDQAFVYDQKQKLNPCTFDRGEFWRFVGWTNEQAQTSYTNGEMVVNLTDEADGSVTLKALWKTTLTDLSLAMGCNNLKWNDGDPLGQNKGWEPLSGETGVGHCGVLATMYANVSTNGILSFKWKPLTENDRLIVYAYGSSGQSYWDESYTGDLEEWNLVTVKVQDLKPDDDVTIEIMHMGVDESSCVHVDQMTWTPEGGGEPTQGDSVAATAAGVDGNVFSLTIPTTEGVAYGVWTNADLTVPAAEWGLWETKSGDGRPWTPEWTILPDVPQLFFRAYEVK